MTTQHTPGPWIHDADATGAVVYQGNSGTIANIPMDLRAFRANARLIAAAPELLVALRGLVATLEGMALHPSHYAAARAAIATATGEA